MGKTNIGWCDNSWNPWSWVCTLVSAGCARCYAKALATRYGKDFSAAPVWRDNAYKELRAMKPGESTFVADMSDFFLERVPDAWRQTTLDAIAARPDVTFLILTKRIERAAAWTFPPNVYLGASVEHQRYAGRIDVLKRIPAAGKFLSLEPLLGPIEADFTGIDGVIVGGESGPQRRPFDKAWARSIRDQCQRDGVRFFLKQGTSFAPGQDRLLDGRTWDDLPWTTAQEARLL